MLKLLDRDLRRHRLLKAGERAGVAVSGGADSVALLRAIAELAPRLGVVPVVLHLDHGLRGEESVGDAAFVAALAQQLGLEWVIAEENVAELADEYGFSLEAAGRRARYSFFLRAAAELRLDAVATAHTQDDQAETVLLRLLRGAGTSGLAAILRNCSLAEVAAAGEAAPDSIAVAGFGSPRLIRPLLGISRHQVEDYLRSLGQPFRQDATNASNHFLRNRVRAGLLPLLEREYNPRLRQALCETAEVAADDDAWLEEQAAALVATQSEAECGLLIGMLRAQPVALQRRLLRRLCRGVDLALDFGHLEELRLFSLAGCAGLLELPRSYRAQLIRLPMEPALLRLLRPGE